MTAARIHEAALLLLLCIGLSLKILLPSKPPPYPVPIVSETFAAFLQSRGFTVIPSASLADLGAVRAISGPCELLALNVVPQGWQRDVVRSQAEPEDTILFIFDGTAYAEQPVLLTWVAHYHARLTHSLHMNGVLRPVIAIVASPGCDLTGMNWPKMTIAN
ncbi:hypothetical protein ABIE65_003368 [Constrictibacter sp. MBR-5]|jgi:hypothetical protein|uniref:hypothetical protein n=1 Tax=Constrictibacter sp. MBR-5 TaxID=3156467 RepID=UPI0033917301